MASDGHSSRHGKVDLSEAVVRLLQASRTQDVAQCLVTCLPCLRLWAQSLTPQGKQNKVTFLGWGDLLLFLLLRGGRNHIFPPSPSFTPSPPLLLSLLPSFSSFLPLPHPYPSLPSHVTPGTSPFPFSSSSALSLSFSFLQS